MQENSSQKLPAEVTDLDGGKISPVVAVSSSLEDYENKTVNFSFAVYNSNQCRIGSIDKTEAKKLTKELKKISLTLTKHFLHQSTSGVACKPVHNSGNYAALFTDVPEDTDLLEVDYSGAGRVFGYLVKNIFNIVAIGKEHR